MKKLIIFTITALLLNTTYSQSTICFEAEETASLKAPFKVTEVKDKKEKEKVSKSKLIEITQGSGSGSEAGGEVSYNVPIPEDGTYYLWVRVWWLDSCGNSFSVKLSKKPKFTFGNDGTYKNWHWVKSKIRLKLKKGIETITISNREDGIKIDQIMLTSDRELVPVDIEESQSLK